MRLLKENLIAWVLLGAIGVAAILLGLSALWFSRGGPEAADAGQVAIDNVDLASAEGSLRDDEAFFEIIERPLFSPDRRPVPVQEIVVEEEPVVEEVEPPKELNAVLTGVVITPDRRIVTLREKDSGDIVRAEEGRPLEGALAGWDVKTIAPRAVDFSARSGESARLEMEVYGEALKAPPPVKTRERPDEAQDAAENEAEPGESDAVDADVAGDEANEEPAEERAQELRRLIAERRERLREQARERREQQDQEN